MARNIQIKPTAKENFAWRSASKKWSESLAAYFSGPCLAYLWNTSSSILLMMTYHGGGGWLFSLSLFLPFWTISPHFLSTIVVVRRKRKTKNKLINTECSDGKEWITSYGNLSSAKFNIISFYLFLNQDKNQDLYFHQYSFWINLCPLLIYILDVNW